MQVTLFKALKSINVDDVAATAVVEQLEEYLEQMKGDATKNLEAQNKGLEAKLDAIKTGQEGLRHQITLFSVLLTVIGLGVTAAIAIAPTLAKLVH